MLRRVVGGGGGGFGGLFDAVADEGFGVVGADEGEEFFADEAAEAEEGAGVGGADDGAKFGGAFGDVGDLEADGFFVPEVGGFDDAGEFGAEGLDVGGAIDVEEGGAEEVGGATGPVLEGFFHEVGHGDDEAAEVPDADDDVAEGDFLDVAPLAFDDDGVFEADGLGDGELEAGEEGADDFLGSEAEDDADDTGGGEEGGPELSDAIESHEDATEGDEDEDGDDDAFEDFDLGVDGAGVDVVGGGEDVVGEEDIATDAEEADEKPGDGDDEGDGGDMVERDVELWGEVRGFESKPEGDDEGDDAGGGGDTIDGEVIGGGDGFSGDAAKDPEGDGVGDEGEEQGSGEDAEVEAKPLEVCQQLLHVHEDSFSSGIVGREGSDGDGRGA